jgi:hypothetical protein
LTHSILHHFISGHAKIIDKFLSDPRANYNDTVVRYKIVFHDEDHEDPDWKVCQCYLLIIASATEIVSGIENLWLSGPSAGRHTYPDFGQYMPINYFKAFALLLHFVGQKSNIGMRMCVMFHGMYFCHVWQILMTSNNIF